MIVAHFETAAGGIRREETLLRRGRPAVLLWTAEHPALVVPGSLLGNCESGQAATEAATQGWPVLMRKSGGGVVPQGPGTLNLAMILPRPQGFTIDDGYRLICATIAEALTRFDIDATTGPCAGSFCDGRWNMLHRGRKLAGTAQRWQGPASCQVVLMHAAILCALPETMPWHLIERLQSPQAPDAPPVTKAAHVALDDLLPDGAGAHSFPGALIRAAEDRLHAYRPRISQMA
ncbi:hypothetical protein AB838_01220 [Rhodobacteraceae bacterium (ex Bugula neritina AB1)]|nr:hypothetical protein AB838_01220 [Rhodobacteraceae bacterium (ex Bugula neritina AB1)]